MEISKQNYQKLIKEYESKVLLMDIVIEKNSKAIRDLKKRNLETEVYDYETRFYGEDRKIAEAKRECYIQFIVDLKTLDYV